MSIGEAVGNMVIGAMCGSFVTMVPLAVAGMIGIPVGNELSLAALIVGMVVGAAKVTGDAAQAAVDLESDMSHLRSMPKLTPEEISELREKERRDQEQLEKIREEVRESARRARDQEKGQ